MATELSERMINIKFKVLKYTTELNYAKTYTKSFKMFQNPKNTYLNTTIIQIVHNMHKFLASTFGYIKTILFH